MNEEEMKKIEKINYMDRIEFNDDLGKLIYKYTTRPDFKHTELGQINQDKWALRDKRSKEILWEGNEQQALGGYVRGKVLLIEEDIKEIIHYIDKHRDSTLWITIAY